VAADVCIGPGKLAERRDALIGQGPIDAACNPHHHHRE
jgi:hypothetical protein